MVNDINTYYSDINLNNFIECSLDYRYIFLDKKFSNIIILCLMSIYLILIFIYIKYI